MVGLAIAMFITLFAFGHEFVGWSDPGGRIQLALFASFIFGIISGYRARA